MQKSMLMFTYQAVGTNNNSSEFMTRSITRQNTQVSDVGR